MLKLSDFGFELWLKAGKNTLKFVSSESKM